ncbi:MAG: tRNA (adenosine(37)-N6)-threonylcarbamoyltransferase complex dimerization subunit type 1 TsaB [Gemmatimonadales bacterium]
MTPSAFSFQRSALLLSLDTATDRPTLALGTPDAPGAEIAANHRHDLSRDIDRLARELFAARGASPRQLAGIVVADGPGSFTGLRIGIAFAKGLCRVLGVPLLAAPSLLGAARAASKNGALVLVEYDALRGDVYRAVYRFAAGDVEVISPPALARAGLSAPVSAARAGARDASAAALLTLVGAAGGPVPVQEPATWEPDYGRPAEAEARRLARDGDR